MAKAAKAAEAAAAKAAEKVAEAEKAAEAAAAAEVWKHFTPADVNTTKCLARVWAGGAGGQCRTGRKEGSDFCPSHAKSNSWKAHGRVDGPIPVKKLQEFLNASKSKKASAAKAAASSGTPSPKKKRASSTPDLSVTPEEPKAKKPRVVVSAVLEAIKVAKPTGGAFGVFLQEKGTAIKASLFDAKRGQSALNRSALGRVNRIASERWKSLTDQEQKVFQSKFDSNLSAYKALPQSQRLPPAKLSKIKKVQVQKLALLTPDGKEVKRSASAYFIFLEEKRQSIKASLPADHKITDVVKQAGALWKALPEEEKKVYQNKYDEKNKPYKDALLASQPPDALGAWMKRKADGSSKAEGAEMKVTRPAGRPAGLANERRKRKKAW